MKHVLLFCSFLGIASTASAEKIYCFFNEPTVNLTYDSDTNKEGSDGMSDYTLKKNSSTCSPNI